MSVARSIGVLARSLFLCAAIGGLAIPKPASAEDPFLRRTPTVRVVQRVGPAVVNITTEHVLRGQAAPFSRDPLFNNFFQDLFEPRLPQHSQSLGSGVVIDAQRHVLTNAHVVGQADSIRVSLADGREFEAELVGADPNNDLAVLRLKTDEGVPWVAPGTSADLMVGEPVIAIGNPFGLSNSVTTGVVSALDRSIRLKNQVFYGFLQTDASINPGNSGGPLLNANGELIGVNSAIYQGAQGIGFAIPIDVAKRVVHELITHGEVAPVWLGLDLQDMDPTLANVMHLPPGQSGALVSRVRAKGPADGHDVKRGDLVTRVNGHPVRSSREVYDILSRSTEAEAIKLSLWRRGKEHRATLHARQVPGKKIASLTNELLGLTLDLRSEGGALVKAVRAGSGAARIGIQAGDLILGVNGRQLSGADALRRAVLDLRGRQRALVVVVRGRGRYHVAVPLS